MKDKCNYAALWSSFKHSGTMRDFIEVNKTVASDTVLRIAYSSFEAAASERGKPAMEQMTSRQLMEELARRGYKGTLEYTQVKRIDITNF